MARPEAMEGDNMEASVCSPTEVYWGGIGGQEESMRKMAAVESVETFASATAGCFVARTLCDPQPAGVAVSGD